VGGQSMAWEEQAKTIRGNQAGQIVQTLEIYKNQKYRSNERDIVAPRKMLE